MKPPESLVSLFQPWNDFYSHSKTAETIVIFLHIGGLLLAGGFAIAAAPAPTRALCARRADRAPQGARHDSSVGDRRSRDRDRERFRAARVGFRDILGLVDLLGED